MTPKESTVYLLQGKSTSAKCEENKMSTIFKTNDMQHYNMSLKLYLKIKSQFKMQNIYPAVPGEDIPFVHVLVLW